MKFKKNLVSIIITYYKKKKYIQKTLNSITNQNYKFYEIILVYDDPNKDDLSYILKLLENFKLKKLITNNKNLGVAKSRNLAKKYCRGEFIAFLDSDDTWKKNKLSYQVNFMKRKSSLISFSSFDVINDMDEILKKRIVVEDPSYKSISRSCFIGLSTVMVHRKILSLINFPYLKTQEDLGLWLKLLRAGIKFNHIKKSLSCWRQAKKSLSSNLIDKICDAFKLYYIYENKNLINSVFIVIMLSYNKIIKKLT
jgi:teichuronic acid biosynthesis glycosyltransferase TuaG